MKKYIVPILAGMVGGLLTLTPTAVAALKVWTSEERVLYTDLNANFAEVANNNLSNSNIATNAAIAHTKMATPALLPKASATLTTVCDGAAAAGTACTVNENSQVTAVKSNATAGQYRVDLLYSPPNAVFNVQVTSITVDVYCVAHTFAATSGDANGTNFIVACKTDAGVAANAAFSIVLLDT